MIHIFMNALAASAGGGLTYVRNVVPHLAARDDVRATVVADAGLRQEFGAWPRVQFQAARVGTGVAARFWFEQTQMPSVIRESGADVLLSAGNFALWNSPVPQILLSRNALYTSPDFMADLRRRGDYRLWLDTELKAAAAKSSIQHADVTVAPSAAFARDLREWTGKDVVAIHHGFDAAAFSSDPGPLPPHIEAKLAGAADALRILFVSHYNYYRNFETLIRALPLLRDRMAPRKMCLMLTCELRSEANPGAYQAQSAGALVQELGVENNVIELGTVPYRLLHRLYRGCDVYVTAAYAESFAHPLVEAMWSEVPVVAADIPVHREICGDSAIYFPRFSPALLAEAVGRLADSAEARADSTRKGAIRVRKFSWQDHVSELVRLAGRLSSARRKIVSRCDSAAV
jgi:glycosyltransferase involved in cell wall biosynthesis